MQQEDCSSSEWESIVGTREMESKQQVQEAYEGKEMWFLSSPNSITDTKALWCLASSQQSMIAWILVNLYNYT